MKHQKWTAKLIGLLLACSMIAGSGVTAFASETDGNQEQILTTAGEVESEVAAEQEASSETDAAMEEYLLLESTADPDVDFSDENVIVPEADPAADAGFSEDNSIGQEEKAELETLDDLIIGMEDETEEEIIEQTVSPVDEAFGMARANLDAVLTPEADPYSRILAIYGCAAASFAETIFMDEELAQLTQKLLDNYDIKNCVLSGVDQEGNTVYWNLAQIGEQYYNLDVSRDRNIPEAAEWTAFLKGGVLPFGYMRDAAFLTDEFMAECPVAEEDYVIQVPQTAEFTENEPESIPQDSDPTVTEDDLESIPQGSGLAEDDPESVPQDEQPVMADAENFDETVLQDEAGQDGVEMIPLAETEDGTESGEPSEEASGGKEESDAAEEASDEKEEAASSGETSEEKDDTESSAGKKDSDKKKKEDAEKDDKTEEEEAVEAESDEELNTASAGKTVWFGKYPQTRVKNDAERKVIKDAFGDKKKITLNGVTYQNDGWSDYVRWDPVEWIVLGQTGDCYKLISKKVLRWWHFSGWDENWRDSEMRSWLNNAASEGFLGSAFNKNERADMQAFTVISYDGREDEYLTTKDKVTLLDQDEVSQVPSAYRIAYGTNYVNEDSTVKHKWWLRGDSGNSYGIRTQSYVNEEGEIDGWYGTWDRGVRPVIWVKTSSKYLYTKYPQDNSAALKGYYPDKVTLNKTKYTMDIGDTYTLKATISPAKAKDKTVKWTSSNKKVATVTSTGKVKAIAKGTATITAKTTNGKTATCKITVTKYKAVTKVTLNKTSLTLNEGVSATLKASPVPAKGTSTTWTWSSSNAKVAAVDKNGKVKGIAKGTATITVKAKNGKKAACTVTVRGLSVQYRTHVQTYGWQNYVSDGAMSGTEGQAKRLEGINIRLANQGYSGDIQYRTHVQTYGWQGWKKNGAMAGTEGQAKRLEAIQIKLTGDLAKHYDIYYRTHVQTFGWSGWAKNGEMCGSAGFAKRLEGINIKLVKKGGKAPGAITNKYFEAGKQIKVKVGTPTLTYTYKDKGKTVNIPRTANISTDPGAPWAGVKLATTNAKVAATTGIESIKIMGPGDADIRVTAHPAPLLNYTRGEGTVHIKVLAEQKISISGLGKYDSTNKRYNVSYTNAALNIKAKASGGGALTYYITDKDGKSVKSDIATIDKNGNLKFSGKKIGSFYVTVKAGKKVLTKGGYAAASKTFMVNVKKGTPVISGNTSQTKTISGGVFSLDMKATEGAQMLYSSGDDSVASVDASGKVTPHAWSDPVYMKTVTITVNTKETAVLNKAKAIKVTVTLRQYIPRTVDPTIATESQENKAYYSWAASQLGVNLPNCTTYALGRAKELLASMGKDLNYSTLKRPDGSGRYGDAGEWYQNNLNNGGYTYSSDVTKPRQGSLIVWSGGSGHIAVVENIDSTGIWISHSSYGGFSYGVVKGDNSRTVNFHYEHINFGDIGKYHGARFQGYVYLV